jgi:hypothetical protein
MTHTTYHPHGHEQMESFVILQLAQMRSRETGLRRELESLHGENASGKRNAIETELYSLRQCAERLDHMIDNMLAYEPATAFTV